MVIVVAITAVSGFLVPAQNIRSWPCVILCSLGAALGGFGITLGLIGALVHMSSLESFGYPYLSPMSPFDVEDSKDSVIRAPLWMMISRPKGMAVDEQRREFDIPPSGGGSGEVSRLNMKRIKKRAVQAAVVLLCLASLSGCFDRRELDTIGIVMGVAIDKAVAEGETELTIQMANPSEKSGSDSKEKNGGSETKPFINVSSTGRNINYIVREMQNKMSRMIYVAHSQVIILGEELAKSGVRDVLDFFARAPEARMTLYVIVAKGKARDMLDITP